MDTRFSYQAGTSPVHRCDARVKLPVLLAYSIGIFFADSWLLMALFVAVPVLLAMGARIPVRALMAPLVPVIVLAAFAATFSIAGNPTAAGVSYGLLIAVRMIALVAASFVVCLTTTSTQLLRAFVFYIAPLRALRVPVDSIAFTLALAIRFIPLIVEEFASVRCAQQARGGDAQGLSPWRRMQLMGNVFAAVLVGIFRHTDNMATAMDARCYGAASRRTSLHG